jgi:hypothetical protein
MHRPPSAPGGRPRFTDVADDLARSDITDPNLLAVTCLLKQHVARVRSDYGLTE